ncbi:MAG: UvrD-helicase domain-containing protein [Armatimonadetes bacterium]|nr:UvrD-helicase domain-containing protein [Armatimonadota bacterium]
MKPPPIPTAEQLAAIESELPKFTISASAGSGKTFVLTRRYVRHITEHGLTPDQILTITFTRKAAAEMKTRIVEMLTERGLMHEAQVAETGPIQTIHSFCDRLLRENSVEAGIDPDFQIMEQSALTLENHVRFVIGQEQMNPYAQALIDQLAGERAWSRNQQGQKSKLEAVIQRLLGELRSSRFRLNDLLAWSEDPQKILEGFLPMLRECHGQDELDKLASLGDGDLIRGLEKLCEETITPEAKKVKVATVIRKCRSSGLEMAENICGILHLAAEAWGRLSFDMAREQEYDMAELERMSVQLLKTHPAVQERVKRQFLPRLARAVPAHGREQCAPRRRFQGRGTLGIGGLQYRRDRRRGRDSHPRRARAPRRYLYPRPRRPAR